MTGIKPYYIGTVYDMYFIEDKFQVNRKYQRKLVWTIEEKRQFIDSISKKYPIPLILLADTNDQYEIIDGMQRLNAIFSFIEGEFGLSEDGEERYFDLAAMPTTSELLDAKKMDQRKPTLDRTLCREIVNYELPFSIAYFKDASKIEDIFRRINSNGKQLSDQELRQAGALGKFPDLVRTLSAEIRRDSSDDKLSLSRMKEVSLSNAKLPYGIYLYDVFWVKQAIISFGNMRLSRDEELVAYILMYMILGKGYDASKKNLDSCYKFNLSDTEGVKLASRIENEITKIGIDGIKKRFRKVFNEIEILLKSSNVSLCEILFGNNPAGLVRSFQVFYLALFELIIIENLKIISYERLLKDLNGLGTKLLNNVSSEAWGGRFRDEKIKAFSGVIRSRFEKNDKVDDPAMDNWVIEFENILNKSKIEQQQIEFKIGLYKIGGTGEFNQNTLDKVIKTLTSIANIGPKIKGYVIVGIADSENDAKDFENSYGVIPTSYRNFKICGIEAEALKFGHGLDAYFTRIRDLIRRQPIEEYTKNYILENMRLYNYFDKQMLVLKIESTTKPLLYDKKYYVRRASSVEEIQPESYADLFERFR